MADAIVPRLVVVEEVARARHPSKATRVAGRCISPPKELLAGISVQYRAAGDTRLCKAANAVVPRLVVVGEVAKARHPDVAGDEDTDCVVELTRLKVVVQQEQHLLTGYNAARKEE